MYEMLTYIFVTVFMCIFTVYTLKYAFDLYFEHKQKIYINQLRAKVSFCKLVFPSRLKIVNQKLIKSVNQIGVDELKKVQKSFETLSLGKPHLYTKLVEQLYQLIKEIDVYNNVQITDLTGMKKTTNVVNWERLLLFDRKFVALIYDLSKHTISVNESIQYFNSIVIRKKQKMNPEEVIILPDFHHLNEILTDVRSLDEIEKEFDETTRSKYSKVS